MKVKSLELELVRDLKRRMLLEVTPDDHIGRLAAEFYFDVLEFEIEHPKHAELLRGLAKKQDQSEVSLVYLIPPSCK